MSNVCKICKNTLSIQVQYDLKNYDVIFKEGYLYCKVIAKSKLDITKQDINSHIKQLLNDNICGICNKDVIVDDINHCKLGLTIFIYCHRINDNINWIPK